MGGLAGLTASALVASALAERRPRARAIWTDRPPRIDGRLDDPVWKATRSYTGLRERRPRLDRRPPVRTNFWAAYDQAALYFAVHCQDSQAERIRALSRARDKTAIYSDDSVSIKIDAEHDHRTTIGFMVNPAGAQLDYRAINESDFRTEFDAVWQAAASRTADGWTVEFRIPHAALGLDPSRLPKQIGFNVTRDHARRAGTYDWALLAPPFGAVAASRYGHLTLVDAERHRSEKPALVSQRLHTDQRQLAIIPYALGGFRRRPVTAEDAIAKGLKAEAEYEAGFDARFEIGSGWRIQATANTDFAQVDIDNQVANLTRFDLFFPEKRDFFLRDFELFAFGREAEAQLLYTRRIGLDQGRPIPILGGSKAVGRVGKRLRVGTAYLVTRPGGDLPWTSNWISRALVELDGGSNLGTMLTYRQSLEDRSDYNWVVGIDGAWRSVQTPLLLQAFSVLSLSGAGAGELPPSGGTERRSDKPQSGVAFDLFWRGRLWRPSLGYAYFAPGLRADLGFFQRVGIHQAATGLTFEPRIERWGIEKFTLELWGNFVLRATNADLLDWANGLKGTLLWDTGIFASLWFEQSAENVIKDFTLGQRTPIAADRYDMSRVTVDFGTIEPWPWPLAINLGATYRNFYGARLLGVAGGFTLNWSLLWRCGVQANADRIIFSDPNKNITSATLNGNFALSFTRNLVLDTLVGWNRLDAFLRLQARVRWRFVAGSDLFVVYQHDSFDNRAKTRFQSLLLKVTYRWAP